MENDQKKYPEYPVLVVDDEKNFLNSVDFILNSNGITNVECCSDSMEVMNLLKNKNYSIILLDLKMKRKSGEELLTEIVKKYPDIPIIMLTATDEIEIAVSCIKKGASDYLVKTAVTEKLVGTIRKTLEMQPHTEVNGLTKIPYYYGGYISPADFYGRKNQLAHIIQKISEAENGKFWHISVIGDHRLGKSSLLKRAEHEIDSKTDSIAVYIDLSEISQAHFTQSIVNKIIDKLFSKYDTDSFNKIKKILAEKKYKKLHQFGLGLSIIGVFNLNFNPKEENHWENFFSALDGLIEKAKTKTKKKKEHKSIVLILDEINAITKWIDFREILKKLRAYAQRSKGLSLLVGSVYPLYQLSKDEWSPFFNIFERINMRELTDGEADELIKLPAKEVGVYYSEEAINFIKMLCGNKPYYIQVLCTKIFEKLDKKKIELFNVESAVEDTLEMLNGHHDQIFDKCTDYQKELLKSIAAGNEEETGKLLSDSSQKDERDMLRDRALIYKTEKGCTIDGLMRRWLLRE